jgi:hypothetical protein
MFRLIISSLYLSLSSLDERRGDEKREKLRE